MYAYIKGIIKEIGNDYIVLDNNDIGYLINVPTPNKYQINQNIIIYIYQYNKNESNVLYGFISKEEKEIFTNLIKVSGIGPKTAINILNAVNVKDLIDYIENNNLNMLTKLPGIGLKTANQIVLDLKGKFKENVQSKESTLLIETLLSLGHDRLLVDKVLTKLDFSNDFDTLLKEAINILVSY